jgi:hypothetical protein
MSFLTYEGREAAVAERRPPRRVYARVDQIELPPPERGWLEPGREAGSDSDEWLDGLREASGVVQLDTVDADWFDEALRSTDRSMSHNVDEADWKIAAIDARLGDLPAVSETEETWLELELEESGPWPLVLLYVNLYAAPLERRLRAATRVLPDTELELVEKTRLDDVADASEDALEAALGRSNQPEAAAVYDVGQGNCTAVIENGFPVLYVDLGGGVKGNRNTFPSALTAFCFTEKPTIVLSHWDSDHWSSANRDPRAYRRTWIVPRQAPSLGPIHKTFLGRILQHGGTVLVWPRHGLASVRAGPCELLKCTGAPSSRNDSGLALVLERAVDGMSGRMLFPGDASYDRIPISGDFTHVVVPHHGAKTHAASAPGPDGLPFGRLVYSFGAGNSYEHPVAATRQLHKAWPEVRATALRHPSGLGHVHVYWDSSAPAAHPPCGGKHCTLTCHNR